MGKELTQSQREFVNRFITGKVASEQARIVSAYQDYLRRADKVQAAIDKIGKIDSSQALLPTLQQQLIDAQVKAASGDFGGAYDDLLNVKNAAKAQAKGSLAQLLPTQLEQEIDKFEWGVDTSLTELAMSRNALDPVLQMVRDQPKPSTWPDLDKAMVVFRQLIEQQARWDGEVERVRAETEAAANRADVLNVKETLTKLGTRIKLMQDEGNSQQMGASVGFAKRLMAIKAKATVDNALLSGETFRKAFSPQLYAYQDLLKATKDMSKFQTRGPAADVKQSFQELTDQEEARLAAAKKRYVKAMEPGKAPAPAARLPAVRTFHMTDVLDDDVDELDGAALTDERIATVAEQAAEKLRALMRQEAQDRPSGDVLLDLTLKSVDDFKGDLAVSLGLKRDGSDWPPERKKLIERMAQDLYQTVLAETPNRAADDNSTITVSGKVYGNPEELGSGGFGIVFRYTSDDGETVAVKILKDEKNRKGMASEMRIHWQASGGESIAGPANVLSMKGAAVGKDGTLMMVMEEGKGGDLNTLSESTNALSMAGLIPEAARTAMVQRTMQQVVNGLKTVHAAGMMHLDMKAVNCMLDADGNVMISDFGQARPLDDDGTVNTRGVSTTKEFAPVEHGRGKIAAADEVFWLGSMLQVMSSDLQSDGTKARIDLKWQGDMSKARTTDLDKNGNKQIVNQTALDRLRNAMLDSDPAKRPSLDAVLMSSYLNDVDRSYAEDDVSALMRAVTAYNRQVGKDIQKLTSDINYCRGKIAWEEARFAELQKTGTPTPQQREASAKQIQTWKDEIETKTDDVAAINARPEVVPLVEAIQNASKPFGTQRVPGEVPEPLVMWDKKVKMDPGQPVQHVIKQ
jgi:serine/threonine protein kinase